MTGSEYDQHDKDLKQEKMKAKYFLGSLLMALLGAIIALFVYTKILVKPSTEIPKDTSRIDVDNARALLTTLQTQEAQIDFTYAAEQTIHGVVHVRTKSMMGAEAENPIMEWFYGERESRPREVRGFGSGVIISSNGYIITNNHVIENAESVDVSLNDNRVYTAEVIGRDPSTDIALLKVKAENLPYVKYGDSDKLKLGEWVLAVGNPFNLTSTVTAGIVSAKGRNLGLIEGDYRIESFIQTDAALNMGNSGGALVNTKGLLVGITSAIISPSGAYAGNSFAIPVSIVKKVVDDLKEYGEVQRAIIGVNIRDVEPEDAEKQKLTDVRGVLITRIIEGGSAIDAGLKENDVIVKFDDIPVNNVAALQEQVSRHRPGDKATVTYFRDGKEISTPIILKNVSGNTSIVTAGMGAEVVFGTRLEPLTPSEMRKYNVDYGVKVTEVNEGKLKELGIKKGYTILSINGVKVKNAAHAKELTNNEKSLKSISGIQTDGTMFNYQFGN
jgi:Do/DeqQ family serine protease